MVKVFKNAIYQVKSTNTNPLKINIFSCSFQFVGNICLRKHPGAHQRRLCLYDWEITSVTLPQRDLASMLVSLATVGRDPREQLETINKLIDNYHNALIGALKSKLPASKEISVPKHQPPNPSQKCAEANASGRNDSKVPWKNISGKSKLNLSKLLDRELFQRMLDYCFLQIFFDRVGGVVLLPRDMHDPNLKNSLGVILKYLEARKEFNFYL